MRIGNKGLTVFSFAPTKITWVAVKPENPEKADQVYEILGYEEAGSGVYM
jgi:hypothetical protein